MCGVGRLVATLVKTLPKGGHPLSAQRLERIVETGGIPKFQVFAGADDVHLGVDTGPLPQLLGNDDASLFVETVLLVRAGQQVAPQLTLLRVEHAQLTERLLHDRRPILTWCHDDTLVEPPGDRRSVVEVLTNLGRYRKSKTVVEGTLKRSAEHWALHAVPTLPHTSPQNNPVPPVLWARAPIRTRRSPGATSRAKHGHCTVRFIASLIEHLFDRDFGSTVIGMTTATAFHPAAPPRPVRPHLTLVAPPAPRPLAPRRKRLAALLAGLTSGFLLAALAAVWGGGSPSSALVATQACALALGLVLVHARIVTVRTRRQHRRRQRAATQVTTELLARAA